MVGRSEGGDRKHDGEHGVFSFGGQGYTRRAVNEKRDDWDIWDTWDKQDLENPELKG